jgi:hypothetical protein
MAHRTPPPADTTPALDLFGLWRRAAAVAQQLDEALLATPPESSDFVVLARAAAGAQGQAPIGRAVASRFKRPCHRQGSVLVEPRRASDEVIR